MCERVWFFSLDMPEVFSIKSLSKIKSKWKEEVDVNTNSKWLPRDHSSVPSDDSYPEIKKAWVTGYYWSIVITSHYSTWRLAKKR